MKYCWECGNKLSDNDKFCDKCGKSQSVASSSSSNEEVPKETTNSNTSPPVKLSSGEISKLEKKITSTGSSSEGLGWLGIILNGFTLFLPDYSVMSFGIILVISVVLIILGRRIKTIDYYTRRNLIALIIVFLIGVTAILSMGGTVGIVGIIVFIYFITSLSSINRLYKLPGYQEKLPKPKYKIGPIMWVLFVICGIGVIIGSLFLDYIKVGSTTYWNNFITSCASGAGGDQYKPTCECAANKLQTENNYNQAILWDIQMRFTNSVPVEVKSAITSCSQQNASNPTNIQQLVEVTKSQYKFPYKIDDITTMVDITAEQGAIRYHYVLSGSDMNNLSNNAIKSSLKTDICQDKDTKTLLDSGVNMEYSYSVSGSNNKYFIVFNKSDCLN